MDITTINEVPAASAEEAWRRAEKLISSAWPQIMAVAVAYASEGSVPHTKLVHDVWPASKDKEKSVEGSKAAAKEEKPKEDPTHQLLQLLIDAIAQLREVEGESDGPFGQVN